MKNLDRHFKCPKSLKTLFSLNRGDGWFKQTLMGVHGASLKMEYAVEPRSAKSVPTDDAKKNRKR